jgi:hypothetical protein
MANLGEISNKYFGLDCAVAKGIYCTVDEANFEDLPTEGTVILYKVTMTEKHGNYVFSAMNGTELYERVEIDADWLKYYRIIVPSDFEADLLKDSTVSIPKKWISREWLQKHTGCAGYSLTL